MRITILLYGCVLLLALLVGTAGAQDEQDDITPIVTDESTSSRPEDLFSDDLSTPSSPDFDNEGEEVMPTSPDLPSSDEAPEFNPPGPETGPSPKPQIPEQPAPKLKTPPRQELLTPEEAQRAKPTGVAVETLVGRGSQAQIVDKSGAVYKVDPETLIVPNKEVAAPQPADEQPQAGDEAVEGEPAKKTNEPNSAEDEKSIAQKAKEQAEKKAAADAVKEADIKKLQELRNQGAYFYTEDDKPITGEELEKRIQDRNVSGIKTVDVYMERWSTATPPEKEDKPVAAEPAPDAQQ